jgi:hypothetical protein
MRDSHPCDRCSRLRYNSRRVFGMKWPAAFTKRLMCRASLSILATGASSTPNHRSLQQSSRPFLCRKTPAPFGALFISLSSSRATRNRRSRPRAGFALVAAPRSRFEIVFYPRCQKPRGTSASMIDAYKINNPIIFAFDLKSHTFSGRKSCRPWSAIRVV